MNNNSRIALLGANGRAGTAVLTELISRGFRVTALVRNPEKLRVKSHGLLRVEVGDITDPRAGDRVFGGCDVIVNCLSNTGNDAPISSRVTAQVIERFRNGRLRRYFVVTGKTVKVPTDGFSFSTLLQRRLLSAMYPAVMRDKQLEYRVLEASQLPWTLIRCPWLVEGGDPGYRASLRRCGGRSLGTSSLARFIVDEMENVEFLRKAPYLFN